MKNALFGSPGGWSVGEPEPCLGATLLRDKTAELITSERNARDALNAILDDLVEKFQRDLCCVKLPTLTGHLWWRKLAYKKVKINKKNGAVVIHFHNAFYNESEDDMPLGDIHSRIIITPEKGSLKVYHYNAPPIFHADTYEKALEGVIYHLAEYAKDFANKHRKYLK